MIKAYKFLKISIIILVILFLTGFFLSLGPIPEKDELSYGVTFSPEQAQSLGLDWKDLFEKVFSDLGVKKIRLSAYWNKIEYADGSFFWDDLDWQVSKASENGAQIILAVGGRLPRWPECHFPLWTNEMSTEDREMKVMEFIKETINRYKNNENIKIWQIENEPFLSHFGQCPPLDARFLDREIALARKLDSRPIMVTDSGELSIWVPAASRADIFGTTMYRKTYSRHLRSYINYPFAPGFFRAKKKLAGLFAKPDKWIVVELQAEPWGKESFQKLSTDERSKTMDFDKFKEMIEYSSQTGFSEFYLWGVEYWAWEKEKNGDGRIWEEARSLF